MGKRFPAMLPEHEAFIRKQHVFFVGSAPMAEDGHINISPKGYDSLRILSKTEVAYLDLTGSGNETSTHLAENGRITLMFVALEGPPMILRLYGTGRVILPDSPEWEQAASHFELLPGARQIITAQIHLVQSSCGYSIPFLTYAGERDTLEKWAIHKGEDGLIEYREEKNSTSLDGHRTPLGERYA